MIYRAIVADSRDPSNNGRVRVMIPALSGSAVGDWIWPLVNAGYLVTPSPGDQVWVTFENEDKDMPVWLGATRTSPEYDLLDRIEALETTVAALAAALASQ